MHGRTGRHFGILWPPSSFLFSLSIGFTLDALWRMSQIASSSQRKGGDHIPEEHQGCECDWRWWGWNMSGGGQDTRPLPELTLGSRSKGSLGDNFWSEHFTMTERKWGHHLFRFLVEEEEFLSPESLYETQHSVWISLLNIVRKEMLYLNFFFFLENKEGTVPETFRF